MDYIAWSDLFSVGVPTFDEEHRELVAIINRCHEACASEGEPGDVFEILNGLVRYAEEHFAHEQAAMDSHHYPERLRHKILHDQFLERVFRLNEELPHGSASVAEEVLEFLKGWLLDHILTVDRRYAPFLAGRTLG